MCDAIMFFAAGFGTRMGALTKDTPKPLIPVAGRPLLDHALELADNYGPLRKYVNAHYLADQITAHVDPSAAKVIVEHPQVLDTGGGLKNALPLLGNAPVFTSNTDAVWSGPNPLTLLKQAWRPDDMDALLLCVPLENAIGRQGGGDFALDDNDRLIRKGDMVYTGVQIIKTDGLLDISDDVFSLNVLWNRMLENGRLFGARYPGKWCDVGHPDGITLAETMLDCA